MDVASSLSSTHHFSSSRECLYYYHTMISFSCGKVYRIRSFITFITVPLRDAYYPVTLHFNGDIV